MDEKVKVNLVFFFYFRQSRSLHVLFHRPPLIIPFPVNKLPNKLAP